MERRHFLKLAFGFAAGAAALAASAAGRTAAPQPLTDEQPPQPGNSDAQPAVTTGDEVDRLAPEQVRWGRGRGHQGLGHGAGAGALGLAPSPAGAGAAAAIGAGIAAAAVLAPPLLAPPLLLVGRTSSSSREDGISVLLFPRRTIIRLATANKKPRASGVLP